MAFFATAKPYKRVGLYSGIPGRRNLASARCPETSHPHDSCLRTVGPEQGLVYDSTSALQLEAP